MTLSNVSPPNVGINIATPIITSESSPLKSVVSRKSTPLTTSSQPAKPQVPRFPSSNTLGRGIDDLRRRKWIDSPVYKASNSARSIASHKVAKESISLEILRFDPANNKSERVIDALKLPDLTVSRIPSEQESVPSKLSKDFQSKLALPPLQPLFESEGNKYYFRPKPTVNPQLNETSEAKERRLAFEVKNDKITTKLEDECVTKEMVEQAAQKGWVPINVSGTDKFKSQVWLAASLRDPPLSIAGYEPTDKDKQGLKDNKPDRKGFSEAGKVDKQVFDKKEEKDNGATATICGKDLRLHAIKNRLKQSSAKDEGDSTSNVLFQTEQVEPYVTGQEDVGNRPVQESRHAADEAEIHKANERIEELCPGSEWHLHHSLEKHRFKLEQFRGANLVHGSTSASLLAFSDYNDKSGKLLPIGVMEKQGKIPFSGEISIGRSGVNRTGLSTAPLGIFEVGLDYANKTREHSRTPIIFAKEFESAEANLERMVGEHCANLDKMKQPELSQELSRAFKKAIQSTDKDLSAFKDAMSKCPSEGRWGKLPEQMNINDLEVSHQRLIEWPKLNADEQKLVERSFPVLYGIKTGRSDDFITVDDMTKEIVLTNGTTPEEIAVIFVPKSQLKTVKDFLERNGHSHIHVDELPDALPKYEQSIKSIGKTEWLLRFKDRVATRDPEILKKLVGCIGDLPEAERGSPWNAVVEKTQDPEVLAKLAIKINDLPEAERSSAWNAVFKKTQHPSSMAELARTVRDLPEAERSSAWNKVVKYTQDLEVLAELAGNVKHLPEAQRNAARNEIVAKTQNRGVLAQLTSTSPLRRLLRRLIKFSVPLQSIDTVGMLP